MRAIIPLTEELVVERVCSPSALADLSTKSQKMGLEWAVQGFLRWSRLGCDEEWLEAVEAA